MPAFYTPSPLRGTPSILEGGFENIWHSTSSANIGEVGAKQAEEYDRHFDAVSFV